MKNTVDRRMVFGGILAGGIGSRMNAAGGLPKQFLKVGGVPVLVRTVRRFLEAGVFDRVLVAMNSNWIDHSLGMLREYGVGADSVRIIPGGADRFGSLVCLAEECVRIASAGGFGGDCVLVNHDCARPFVTKEILLANAEAMKDAEAVTTSIPTIDTVLISEDGRSLTRVPDRSTVFLDQGPQAFECRKFLDIVRTLTEKERSSYMEAGRMYAEKGCRVMIVPGDRGNFKMTTPFDIELAEALLEKGVVS